MLLFSKKKKKLEHDVIYAKAVRLAKIMTAKQQKMKKNNEFTPSSSYKVLVGQYKTLLEKQVKRTKKEVARMIAINDFRNERGLPRNEDEKIDWDLYDDPEVVDYITLYEEEFQKRLNKDPNFLPESVKAYKKRKKLKKKLKV